MGMYATCSTAEESHRLEMAYLKKEGYLSGYVSGSLNWTSGSSIRLTVEAGGYRPNIRFRYFIKRWSENDERDIDYSFPLVRVPCNLGGFRWAFRCTLTRNGVYCGRIAYRLYRANSDYFGCRKCIRIVYESQRKCRSRFEFFGKILDAEEMAEKLSTMIHKWHYKGKPTRKVKRLKKLECKMPPLVERLELENRLLRKHL